MKRVTALFLAIAIIISLTACGDSGTENDETAETGATETESLGTAASEELILDSSAWSYDESNDVYYQIGVVYCSTPAATEYESMGIYVPGAYMSAQDNGDGTYTCTMDGEGSVSGYTAETAPIVIPVNTAGYSAQAAPTSYSYSGISSYLESGFIYVYAGCRGRSNGYDEDGNLSYSGGAPWGVTDLKAAVRYLRLNADLIPGDTDSIFTFGHSGGGAQSALMGATGDSELYYDYLESIGAAMYDSEGNYISDAIAGAMCWCPITSLDYADEAYEWMMGQYSTSGTRQDDTWTSALSDDLAAAFADYINQLGLTDASGTILALDATESGIYTAGTYYDYIVSEIERSLNNFLSDTTFPYTSGSSVEMADGGFGGAGEMPEGGFEGEMPDRTADNTEGDSGDMDEDGIAMEEGSMPDNGDSEFSQEAAEGDFDDSELQERGNAPGGMNNGSSESVTYETAADYIDSLNSDETWIEYDEETNTATITSVEAFVNHCKSASKAVGAFDDLNRDQAENLVFGDDNNDALHFDATMAAILKANQDTYSAYSDWDGSYVEAYQEYLDSVDALGSDSLTRQNMYNPMYYLADYYDGYETSSVATYWRIHTGINQGDTSLTVETNLALALSAYDGVESVDFEMVWEQGHTTAERTGDSTTNFIQWVNDCLS